MPGFGPDTIEFLRDLSANNDRDWFRANRGRYEQHWLAPALAFVTAAGPAVREFAPDVHVEPRIDGSLFRIHRDVRFSADTSPYKGHLHLWFWHGDRPTAVTGFHLRITPTTVEVAAGARSFDRDHLRRFRNAVVEPAAGAALLRARTAVAKAGHGIGGEELRSAPRGWSSDDPRRVQLLRHRGLFVTSRSAHPATMGTARFATWCTRRWRQMAPIHRWLVDHVA